MPTHPKGGDDETIRETGHHHGCRVRHGQGGRRTVPARGRGGLRRRREFGGAGRACARDGVARPADQHRHRRPVDGRGRQRQHSPGREGARGRRHPVGPCGHPGACRHREPRPRCLSPGDGPQPRFGRHRRRRSDRVHAQARRRIDHLHRLDIRHRRVALLAGLFGGQVRHRRPDEIAGADIRARRGAGERGLPRPDAYADADAVHQPAGRSRGGCSQREGAVGAGPARASLPALISSSTPRSAPSSPRSSGRGRAMPRPSRPPPGSTPPGAPAPARPRPPRRRASAG